MIGMIRRAIDDIRFKLSMRKMHRLLDKTFANMDRLEKTISETNLKLDSYKR